MVWLFARIRLAHCISLCVRMPCTTNCVHAPMYIRCLTFHFILAPLPLLLLFWAPVFILIPIRFFFSLFWFGISSSPTKNHFACDLFERFSLSLSPSLSHQLPCSACSLLSTKYSVWEGIQLTKISSNHGQGDSSNGGRTGDIYRKNLPIEKRMNRHRKNHITDVSSS